MKITSITISRGITVNLGNYESERYDITLTAECDGDYKAVADSLQLEAAHLLALQLVERIETGRLDRIQKSSKYADNHLKMLDQTPEFKWLQQLDPDEARELEKRVELVGLALQGKELAPANQSPR